MKVGVYYGQCSVLCGKAHSGMPIAVRVVPEPAYKEWLAAAKAKDWKKARGILRCRHQIGRSAEVRGSGAALIRSRQTRPIKDCKF